MVQVPVLLVPTQLTLVTKSSVPLLKHSALFERECVSVSGVLLAELARIGMVDTTTPQTSTTIIRSAMESLTVLMGEASVEEMLKKARGMWLHRKLVGAGASQADVLWAWVHLQHKRGKLLELARAERGHAALQRACWKERAELMLRDWGITPRTRAARSLEEVPMSEQELLVRVLRALQTAAGVEEDVDTFLADAAIMREAWMAVKGQFKGEGGHGEFRAKVGRLMESGRVQGSLGVREGSLTSGLAKVEKRTCRDVAGCVSGYMSRELTLCLTGGSNHCIALDMGAGTQSLRGAAEKAGLIYLPLDLEEWMWSSARGCWVQNLVVDLRGQPGRLWEQIRAVVLGKLGLDVGVQPTRVRWVWMSPPCRTFSQLDAANRSRGWGYRDHRKPTRPPLRTVRGRQAIKDDVLVREWLQFAEWVRGVAGRHCHWHLENPVGSLIRRPYMKPWARLVVLVDYCTYGRRDQKPTHVWTTLGCWVPRGSTSTGLCAGLSLIHI